MRRVPSATDLQGVTEKKWFLGLTYVYVHGCEDTKISFFTNIFLVLVGIGNSESDN